MADQRKKVWEIQTQLFDTYGQPYIDVDGLKNRLDLLYKKGTISGYALIIHDRDIYTQEEEDKARDEIAKGSKRKAVRAGDRKPEHIHVPVRLKNAHTRSAVAKLFGLVEVQIANVNRSGSATDDDTFDDKCAYLCHERHPDKAQYTHDEVVCTFDYDEMMRRYTARMARKGKSARSRAFRDEHVNLIAEGKESVAEFQVKYGFAIYEADKRHYDNAEQHYMRTAYQGEGFRLTILITGPSTVGKTPLAKIYACSMFKEIENPRKVYFSTGDHGATLQGYSGQPVIIWDDYRAADFLNEFERETLFNSLFSVHPEPTEYNIKYGSIVLRHTVNIITCVDSVDTFAKELAGQYIDKKGNFHKGEEKQVLQMYKRIWGLSEVTEEEIVFMVNCGYYQTEPVLALYRQYQALFRVQNKTAILAEKYDPHLYGHIGEQSFPLVNEKYQEQVSKERAKISDVRQFDPKDLPAMLPLESGNQVYEKYDEPMVERLDERNYKEEN